MVIASNVALGGELPSNATRATLTAGIAAPIFIRVLFPAGEVPPGGASSFNRLRALAQDESDPGDEQ